jgi:hypothetical protein
VAIGEYVRLDHYILAHNPLGGKLAAIDLRLNPFDDDARASIDLAK